MGHILCHNELISFNIIIIISLLRTKQHNMVITATQK